VGEIRKQGIQNTVISYTGIGIGFLYTLILLPLFLTPEEVGLTRVLFSLSTILAIIFPVGLAGFTIKFFPAFRDPEKGHHGYLRLLLLTALCCFLLFSVALYFGRNLLLARYADAPLVSRYFYFILPISFCIGMVSLLNVYCSSLFRTTVPVLLNEVYLRLAWIAAIALYYFGLVSFHTFVYVFTGCFMTHLLFLFIYVVRIDNGLLHPIDWAHLAARNRREMLSYILYLAPASIASMALRHVDVSMLGSNLNPGAPLEDVAVYAIGFTIGSIIEAPFNSLARITDTKISDAIHRGDMKTVGEIYTHSTRILMVVGGLLLLGVVCNIGNLLSFLPPRYAASDKVAVIIGVSSFFNMATGLNSSIIFYSDRYRQGALLLIGLILTSVLLNYLLIPLYGPEGAAVATGTALLLFNIVKWALIRARFGIQPYGRYALVVPAALLACMGASYLLPAMGNRYLDLFLRSALVTVIYGAFVLGGRILPEAHGPIKKYTGIKR
jgi:O-antigen/teichoic acid export membrane protein